MNLVKENLQQAIPSLVALVDVKGFPWDKIEGLFNKKIDERVGEGKGVPITVEVCIYDLIIADRMQKPQAMRLLQFINRLFEELTLVLEAAEKSLLKRPIQQMLESMDGKYLNFVGELAALNLLLKSGIYRLAGIEVKMPNGKFIDFKLRQVEQDKFLLVEVVNIHLDSSRVVNDAEAIRKRLMHKLSGKIEDKSKGLENNAPFYLIPVIWGGWKDIKIYSEFFEAYKLELPGVIEPVAYLNFHDGEGYCEHYFGRVSTLFDRKPRLAP